MHIYNRKTKSLKTFSDFEALVDYYANQTAADQLDLFFWNFGCVDWVTARSVLTDEVLEEKSFAIPKFPKSLESESHPTVKIDSKNDGFRVIEWAAPAPTPPPPTSSKVDNIVQSSKPLTESTIDFAHQRKFKRYVVRLKVIISNKQKTFLSYSRNISEGGILLEDRIPKYMFNEKSEVYVSSPNRREIIAFRCLPLGDEENPNRLIFQQSQREHLEKLRLWLESAKVAPKSTSK